jgi:hypothetical protein
MIPPSQETVSHSGGGGWSPNWVQSARRPLNGLLYLPRVITIMENEDWQGKPAPAPICPPQIPLDQTRARTRVAAVGSQRLTAWAMARPIGKLLLAFLEKNCPKRMCSEGSHCCDNSSPVRGPRQPVRANPYPHFQFRSDHINILFLSNPRPSPLRRKACITVLQNHKETVTMCLLIFILLSRRPRDKHNGNKHPSNLICY